MNIKEIIAAINHLNSIEMRLNDEQFQQYLKSLLMHSDGLNYTHAKIQEITARHYQR